MAISYTDNSYKYSNPRFMRSSQSEIKPVGQLDTPVISRNGSKIQWSAISGANIYKVYDNTGAYTNVQSTEFSLNTNTVGSYSYYIYAYYLDSEGVEYISNQSNTISFTVEKITAPVIDLNTGTSELYFSAVGNATKYYMYTNGAYSNALSTAYTSADPYIIVKDTVGTYTFKLQALNDNLGWYNNTVDTYYNASNNSNEISYQVIKIATPSTITYDTVSNEISWSSSTNAGLYELYINDVLVQDTANLFYTITTAYSDAMAYVIAHKSQVTNPNPKYLPSTKAEAKTVSFGKLPTPILTNVNNVFSWTNLSDNTEYYKVYNGDVLISTTSSTTKTILTNTAQTFNIKVIADAGDSATISDSDVSNSIEYTFYKLTAPILDITDNVLSWTQPPNALTYDVYLNDSLIISNTGATAYDLNATGYIINGKNEFTVKALNNSNPQYLTSDASNSVEINNNGIVYSCNINGVPYNLQLPIHPTFTEDNSLDTAEITLVYNDNPNEIPTGVPVDIFVNDIVNNVALKEWNFMLLKDTVVEVQIGASSKYKHNLDLIELTRKLQSEFIPNVAITQPLDYVNSIYSIDAQAGVGNIVINNTMQLVAPESSSYYNDHYVADISANISSIRVATEVSLNTTISLPKATTGYLYREYLDGFRMLRKQNIALIHKQYYLKNVTTGVETLIVDTTSNLDIKYKLETPGNYQIILRIPDIQAPNTNAFYDDDIFLIKFMTEEGTNINGINQLQMYDTTIGDDNDYQDMKQSFEMTWNIAVNDSVETDNKISENTYTCWDAIVKIINNLNPLEISDTRYITTTSYPDNNEIEEIESTNKIQSPKYSLDDDVRELLQSKICPKLTFENNKTLYEALANIGLEFNGIPRLLKYKNGYNNVITYDLLNENSSTSFDDEGTELDIISSSLDRYSTGIISNVSNMVSKDNEVIYPSSNSWVSARSTNVTDPYVTKMNMGIILPSDIHQLIKLEAKMPVSGDVFDLTSKIIEKKKWDTLDDDENGKGLSLYWERGSNKIYNMGALIAQSETEAIWGLSSSTYVIQNVLENLGVATIVNDVTSDYDLNNVVYRVTYVPYTNTRLMLEKNNQYDVSVELFTNFNQDDNTITDANYGKASQVNLSKMGNTEVSKDYKFYTLDELPKLGQYKIINDEKYYVDKYSFSIHEQYINCSVLFTKNSNKLNPRMGIKNDYRQYELYDTDWVDRVININHYCYLDTKEIYGLEQNDFDTTQDNLIHNIGQSFNYLDTNVTKPYKAPDTFYITPKKNLNDVLTYTPYESTTDTAVSSGLLQANNLTVGNAISIFGKCYDNFSLGIKATNFETTGTVYHGSGKYIQKNIRYVDDLGKCPFLRIALGNLQSNTDATTERMYPEAYFKNSLANTLDNMYLDKTLYIQKDNRECLNFNYQINFVSKNKNISIHSGLTKYIFTNESDPFYNVGRASPVYVLYKGNIQDCDYVIDYKEITTPQFYRLNEIIQVKRYFADTEEIIAYDNYDGIALVWMPKSQNGNSTLPEIIYSYRKDIKKGDVVDIPTIYWNFTDTKII